MRFAYADPPYLGCAAKLYGDPTYDDPGAHVDLMFHLDGQYDAWALSLHEPSLRVLLPAAPPGVRVAVWVKPFASFKPGVDPAYTWEPVIYRTARKASKDVDTVRDHHVANITLKRGLAGAKPASFCYWIFGLLGADPTDDFADIFPGTGGVTVAWDAWCQRDRVDQGTLFDSEAANRAPTHAELVARIRIVEESNNPPEKPGAPQQDGPSTTSAPAEGASEGRTDTTGHGPGREEKS